MSSRSTIASKRSRRSQASVGTKSGSTYTEKSRLTSTPTPIILKLALVVICMTVGAILALGINLIWSSKMIYAAPGDKNGYQDDLDHLEILGEPKEYCLFQHRTTKKCLAIVGPGTENETLLMMPCAEDLSEARYQTFHYDPTDKLLKIKKIEQQQGSDFADVCVTSASIPTVTRCISPANKSQIYYYTKDFRFYNDQNDDKKECITASTQLGPTKVVMEPCHKKNIKKQQFKCIKLQKSRIFKPNPDLHKNYKPPLLEGESEVTDYSLRNKTDTAIAVAARSLDAKVPNECSYTVDAEKKTKQDKQEAKPAQEEAGEQNKKQEPKGDKQKEKPAEDQTGEENGNIEPKEEKKRKKQIEEEIGKESEMTERKEDRQNKNAERVKETARENKKPNEKEEGENMRIPLLYDKKTRTIKPLFAEEENKSN